MSATHSMLMAARKRLTQARRNRTIAGHYSSKTSGLGPERMKAAATREAAADQELAEAEAHHRALAEQFMRHERPDLAPVAVALRDEMERADAAPGDRS